LEISVLFLTALIAKYSMYINFIPGKSIKVDHKFQQSNMASLYFKHSNICGDHVSAKQLHFRYLKIFIIGEMRWGFITCLSFGIN